MSSNLLDSSIDAAYQEAIRQIISSGALDISTEAYNSALALSTGRTPVSLSPNRINPVVDVYLSAAPSDEDLSRSGPSSAHTFIYDSAQQDLRRQPQDNAGIIRKNLSRNTELATKPKREVIRMIGVDQSLLSYSALGTPKRHIDANKNTDANRKQGIRRNAHNLKTVKNKSMNMERSSARKFLANLGLTQDTLSPTDYEELLGLLLAIKRRNFCDLNKVLSLFPYNAALNSACTSVDKREVREKLIEILRPSASHSSSSAPPTDCPNTSELERPRLKTTTSRRNKWKPSNIYKANVNPKTDALLAGLGNDKSTNSAPGIDYYYKAVTNDHVKSSLTTSMSTSNSKSRSDPGSGALPTSSVKTHPPLSPSITQEEIANLREMNTQLMHSHDIAVQELDHVTTKLNKEMAKTAQLQAMLLQGLEGLNSFEQLNKGLYKTNTNQNERNPQGFAIKSSKTVDIGVSCNLITPYTADSTKFATQRIDEEVQVLPLWTHSIGTSPRLSNVTSTPLFETRPASVKKLTQRRSTNLSNSTPELTAPELNTGSIVKESLTHRSSSCIDDTFMFSTRSHDNLTNYDTAKLSVVDLNTSIQPAKTPGLIAQQSLDVADSLLDLITGYIGSISMGFKDQISLSYSLAQLFRIGWYDTPCTRLAAIALLDIELFETGEFTYDIPEDVEAFIKESYATKFGAFFVRPYDHALLTLLLLCVYPAVIFQFATDTASFLAPVLHDVDKSTRDDYSSSCLLFASLLILIKSVNEYFNKGEVSSLVGSMQALLKTIKDNTIEIETSCLLPVLLAIVRLINNRKSTYSSKSADRSAESIADKNVYDVFITTLEQLMKKISLKLMSDDAEETPMSPEQQIAMRIIGFIIKALNPLKRSEDNT